MRRLLPLLVVGVSLLVGCGGDDAGPTTTTTTSTSTTSTTSTIPPPTSSIPMTPPTMAPNPAVAGLLGDSLLHQVRQAVRDQWGGGALVIESAPGLEAFDARHAIAGLRDNGVGTIGIVLGTNNARDGYEDRDLRVLEGIARATSFATCQRWVTVTETTPDVDFNEAARTINAGLAALAAERAGLELVDWAGAIAANPEWLAADGLHHTPEGQAALAGMLVEALRECTVPAG